MHETPVSNEVTTLSFYWEIKWITVDAHANQLKKLKYWHKYTYYKIKILVFITIFRGLSKWQQDYKSSYKEVEMLKIW